ncbi:MAG: methylated-DNA-[protein]-cysteine S-methyltransferase [Flavobacteriales bacterium]|jgi:methylated-DNA-[protein]-cysteine S-methyltransferase
MISQLQEYFEGKRQIFMIETQFIGTEFQKSVWNDLIKIPFGVTKSYFELSTLLDTEKAIRAVAPANGTNAISILVPCHRIIGNQGELTGYAGGLSAKKKLLELEESYGQQALKF